MYSVDPFISSCHRSLYPSSDFAIILVGGPDVGVTTRSFWRFPVKKDSLACFSWCLVQEMEVNLDPSALVLREVEANSDQSNAAFRFGEVEAPKDSLSPVLSSGSEGFSLPCAAVFW
ncbi:Uncharacterized protein Rs2_39715 [Raphanus sativus]|nr:Uncharacterized protein Rs2_39715 [Raphanus sativus]